MMIRGIDVTHLFKARDIFEEFRQNMNTDRDKAGAIQAFEFSYELAWKTMKRLLDKAGIKANSPRDVFREAAMNGLIVDPRPWFDFIEIRNMSTHTYDVHHVDDVLAVFEIFSQELKKFIESIGQLT